MEHVKEMFLKRGGRDDEEQGAAAAAEGLGTDKSVVVDGNEAAVKGCLAAEGQIANEGFREGAGWVGLEVGADPGLRWVICAAGCPRVRCGQCGPEDAGKDALAGGSLGVKEVAEGNINDHRSNGSGRAEREGYAEEGSKGAQG